LLTGFPKIADFLSFRITEEVFTINTKKIFTALLSLTLSLSAITFPASVAKASDETFTITFVGFDGETLEVIETPSGEPIDYSVIDTDSLKRNIDKYTQVKFHAWDYNEKYATKDVTIQALYQRATLTLLSTPARTEFYSKSGIISLDGLIVDITLITQTAKFNASGNRVTESSHVRIENSCYTVPATLDKAFASSDTTEVSIYPPDSELPILTYDITYFEGLGDANLDNSIDSVDASFILSYYSKVSTGKDVEISDDEFKCADVDTSGSVDAVDASLVLTYYAASATGGSPNWETIAFG